jgi:succinate dehydrogenase/fumarate reductase flavoprotein subunit
MAYCHSPIGLDDVRTDFQVIVIGGGGSGLAAAVSAAEHGLAVLVLEKRPECGGIMGFAVGPFTG